ncbi:hypothetical protein WMY93_007087 [Mugilogobius chulae]|uniref:VPS10 domain-containing protein n=1 Tax=Mugilogobius chulae TaxID=88201 RepID=A0AAW0PV84_9GOBI
MIQCLSSCYQGSSASPVRHQADKTQRLSHQPHIDLELLPSSLVPLLTAPEQTKEANLPPPHNQFALNPKIAIIVMCELTSGPLNQPASSGRRLGGLGSKVQEVRVGLVQSTGGWVDCVQNTGGLGGSGGLGPKYKRFGWVWRRFRWVWSKVQEVRVGLAKVQEVRVGLAKRGGLLVKALEKRASVCGSDKCVAVFPIETELRKENTAIRTTSRAGISQQRESEMMVLTIQSSRAVSHQLRRRSQFSEVPPHLLRAEPAVPPTKEDWALAYSHDQKLYSSVDFGRKWQLVHEHVTPNRFYWSVLGLDKESDLVHMEAHTPDGNVQYVTCRALLCSEPNREYPFPGYVDINSLIVQDDYIFIQVPTSGRATYYVSYKREQFIQIKLPKYSLPKDLHIVSTDEKQVFAAVQEWNQNDTYNLYLSDTRGIYFTLAMENVKTTRGLGGNQNLDLYEVAGIKGMLIANKRQENQVKTYITYNKGRDWRLLQAPSSDLEGNDIHCILPFCSLHLQLQMSENPYLSGAITTKSSAPGIIVATGNIGPELSYNNVGMFISSDAGNSWRQIFEEEHNVWFLDKGGALVAVKQPSVPTRNLWISFDEGRQWTQHTFSSVPLFVDGVLVDAGAENQIMTFFGHFSHRSEWQLIKIDYKSIFSRKCTEEDYQTWHLHNQGEPCVMGQKQIYMKRRPGNYCMLGKDYSRILSAESCICRAHDFEWYRKVVLNNCTKGVKDMYTARKQQCPNRSPKGLQLSTRDGKLTAHLGTNVTFVVNLDELTTAQSKRQQISEETHLEEYALDLSAFMVIVPTWCFHKCTVYSSYLQAVVR